MNEDADKIQQPESSTAKCYAKRLTSPFSGVIQIVETDKARALSLNGKDWEMQYLHEAPASFWGRKGDTTIIRRYARVARLSDIPDSSSGNNYGKEPDLNLYPHDPRIDRQSINQECENLLNIILYLKVPLTIQDNYEYWLMDEDEKNHWPYYPPVARKMNVLN